MNNKKHPINPNFQRKPSFLEKNTPFICDPSGVAQFHKWLILQNIIREHLRKIQITSYKISKGATPTGSRRTSQRFFYKHLIPMGSEIDIILIFTILFYSLKTFLD